ncbi:MAG: peptide ABC transporter substrate-binding protein [bacterium]
MSWFRVILVCVAVFLTVGCSRDDHSGVLRVAVPGQPANLDVNRTYDAIAGLMLLQMHEGLTRHDQDLAVQPALASHWEFSDDFKSVVFHLRPDATWSDGKPIVAGDFEYGWKRLLDPKTAAEYAYFMFDIVGAEAFNNGSGTAQDVGVHAVDAHTLSVQFNRAAPYFTHITTFIVTHPVRRDIVEKYGDAWTLPENIVVSGAFRPTELQPEYRMTLEPNPFWVLGKPAIQKLELYMTAERSTSMNLFISGDLDVVVDMLPLAIPAFAGNPAYVNAPKLETRYVGFRVDKAPFDNVKVRQALAHAIQRVEFPGVLKGGEIPAAAWLPPGMFGHTESVGLQYDPDRARALLAEAGYPDGKGFPDTTLLFRAGEDWSLIAENLQEQWRRELNIPIKIEVREQKVFFQEIDGESPPPRIWRGGLLISRTPRTS